MICGQCGIENQPGQKFCGECGSPLLRTCARCESVNPPSNKFCGECGSALSGVEAGRPGPAASPTPADEPSQERRVVSVLFGDLCGFTPFSESRDPEEVRDFLTGYFEVAAEIVARFGGVVDKFIGDAVMGVWGATVAREDDAERAVRAGLELVEAVEKLGADVGVELTARVGVLTGEAAVGPGGNRQGLVIGDMVNTASRLQASAPPGAVVVGESTFRLCEDAVAFEPLGDQDLKGKSLPVGAWRALRVVGMRGGDRRVEGLEAPFVGRDEELRLLKDQLHAAGREDRARLVSITGIAGIGKSRLVWELTKYVDGLVEDVYWHEGRSPAYGEGIAFWALAEMVRGRARIAETDDPDVAGTKLAEALQTYVLDEDERGWLEPRLAGLLGLREMPSGERGELFSAFRRFFERISQRGTTVLVFEDLQWADTAMLDFVEELPEWSREHPILVICLARPELLERRPGWGAGRRSVVSLHLGPLSDEAVRALVTGLVPSIPDEAAELVVGRAAGIPLYAVELVRMLLLEGRLARDDDGAYHLVGDVSELAVPESLHAVIGARLDRLEPDDRALILDAAVLGQTFTTTVLSALTGRDPESLSERLSDLVRKELLTFDVDPRSPERGQYGFVQSLIREVAYSRLSRQDRRARHLEVARHFEQTGDVELAGIVADHYQNALRAVPEPDPDLERQTVSALRLAADRATALHSHEQVLGYCEQALDLLTDSPERAEWWERAARAAHALARFDEAESHAQGLVDSHAEQGDPKALLRSQLLLARVLIESNNSQRALELLEPVASGLGDVSDDPDGAALVALLARAHMLSGNIRESADVVERALFAAERQENYPVLADALVTRGTALGDLGRIHEGVALLRAALEIAQSHDLALTELRARGNLSYVLGPDDPEMSVTNLQAGLDHTRQLGEFGWMLFFAHNLVGSLFWSGRWDDTAALIREFEERELSERERSIFMRQRAVYTAMSRDPDEARELLKTVAPMAEADPDPQSRRSWYVQRGLVALAAGDADTAYDLALETIEFDTFGHPEAYLLAALASLSSGDPERPAAVYTTIEGLPRHGRPLKAARAALGAALALQAGDDDRAEEEIDRLGQIADDRSPLLRAQLFGAVGTIGSGRHPAADKALREAREIFRRLGAEPLLRLLPEPTPATADAPVP